MEQPLVNGKIINICKEQLTFNKNIFQMKDSSPIKNDITALKQLLEEDGYVYLKGFHSRENIFKAKKEIQHCLQEMNALSEKSNYYLSIPNSSDEIQHTTKNGTLGSFDKANKSRSILFNKRSVEKMNNLNDVLSAPYLLEFFDRLFEVESATLKHKWLRAVIPGDYTGIHADQVYMGNGSQNLTTVWTPIDDVPHELGGLVVCKNSQKFDGAIAEYRKENNSDGGKWYGHKPLEIINEFGGEWKTSDYQAGDIVLFGLNTLHASTNNMSNRFRFSCDTRFQPANEPVDDRHELQERVILA